MAKRRRKTEKKTTMVEFVETHRSSLLKLLWGLVIGLSALFGYVQGYPLVQAGQVGYGILMGFLYGVGAFLAVLGAFYINYKLRGN